MPRHAVAAAQFHVVIPQLHANAQQFQLKIGAWHVVSSFCCCSERRQAFESSLPEEQGALVDIMRVGLILNCYNTLQVGTYALLQLLVWLAAAAPQVICQSVGGGHRNCSHIAMHAYDTALLSREQHVLPYGINCAAIAACVLLPRYHAPCLLQGAQPGQTPSADGKLHLPGPVAPALVSDVQPPASLLPVGPPSARAAAGTATHSMAGAHSHR